MQELINQIIELIQNTNIWTRAKSEWIERLPSLGEEELRNLLKVLQAKSREELDVLQQENLEKLNENVAELEKITKKGVDLVYARGEEITRRREAAAGEAAIAELQEL